MSDDNGALKLTKWLKLVGAVIATIILIGGAIVGFEARYATADDVKKLEIQTIQTFEQFRQGMEVTDQNRKLNFLVERYYRLKDMMRKYSNDQDLKEEYSDVKQQIKDLKTKMGR